MLAVSAKTGEGLDALRDVLASVGSELKTRRVDGAARLPVDRVFSVKGFGTVVTGTLVSGRIREDDELTSCPRGLAVKVRGVQVHGRREGVADPGHRVAVNLGGVEVDEISRGDTLCTPGAFEPTAPVDVRSSICSRCAGRLRHGSPRCGSTRARPSFSAASRLAPIAGAARSAAWPADQRYARIRSRGPRCAHSRRSFHPSRLFPGDDDRRRHRAGPASAAYRGFATPRPRHVSAPRCAAKALVRDESAVLSFVDERRAAGLAVAELVSRAGLSTADARGCRAERLRSRGASRESATSLVVARGAARSAARLLALLNTHHESQPLSEGTAARRSARAAVRNAAAPVFDDVLTTLAGAGQIVARDRLALAGHQLSLTPEESAGARGDRADVPGGGACAAGCTALHGAAGLAPAVVERMTKLLVRQKTLVKLDTLLFHTDALRGCGAEVKALKVSEGSDARVDVAAFKQRYGITRKYAIPLLEYLDRERVTRRVGDARIVRLNLRRRAWRLRRSIP